VRREVNAPTSGFSYIGLGIGKMAPCNETKDSYFVWQNGGAITCNEYLEYLLILYPSMSVSMILKKL